MMDFYQCIYYDGEGNAHISNRLFAGEGEAQVWCDENQHIFYGLNYEYKVSM